MRIDKNDKKKKITGRAYCVRSQLTIRRKKCNRMGVHPTGMINATQFALPGGVPGLGAHWAEYCNPFQCGLNLFLEIEAWVPLGSLCLGPCTCGHPGFTVRDDGGSGTAGYQPAMCWEHVLPNQWSCLRRWSSETQKHRQREPDPSGARPEMKSLNRRR